MSSKRKILVFLFLIFAILLDSGKERAKSEKEIYLQEPFTQSQN